MSWCSSPVLRTEHPLFIDRLDLGVSGSAGPLQFRDKNPTLALVIHLASQYHSIIRKTTIPCTQTSSL
ncbi:hypothetical protein CPB83DRAFT_841932 [Crepidotus variabilis]|uniref:Uncharacterized protein n=1 Tax=Crepidotus variabilis TaxID=179855 RepID=A0A9P6JWV6_9AGAR|nr:hypothetical protein CPB83DRAFT_841932 [Crepidotus variabilis]